MMAKMPRISMFMLLSPFMPIHRSSSCVPQDEKADEIPRAARNEIPYARRLQPHKEQALDDLPVAKLPQPHHGGGQPYPHGRPADEAGKRLRLRPKAGAGARRAACLVACIVMVDDSFRKSAAYARVWIASKICCTMRSSPCWIFSMVSYSSASPRDRRNASVHRSIRKDSPGVQICAVSLMAGITSI